MIKMLWEGIEESVVFGTRLGRDSSGEIVDRILPIIKSIWTSQYIPNSLAHHMNRGMSPQNLADSYFWKFLIHVAMTLLCVTVMQP